jgi:hypothetical protein
MVARRIDLPCQAAGFPTAPPCRLQLKFLPQGETWTLLALTEPGLTSQVSRWLLPFGPLEVLIAPGLAPKVLRAKFDALPAAWTQMLSTVRVQYVQLTPEGSASIFVEDSPDKVDGFVATLRLESFAVRQRKTQAGPAVVRLTARQLEVLALAVALGYYETPHKVSLRTLASKLGLSVGAVSELLRRGESLIITNYVDTLSAASWHLPDEPSA